MNPRPSRKRASRACDRCHGRKVRCDGSIMGFPCTNCRLDESPCEVSSDAPKAKRMRGSTVDNPTAIRNTGHDGSGSLPFSHYAFLAAPGLRDLAPAEATFLSSQGCLDVPTQEVLDTLVQHYFLYVHPCYPVIDEAAFWKRYRSPSTDHGISILLFQAMIFAASCFVPVGVATRCGYDSLIAMRDSLYRKTRLLYEANVDTDPLTISRSALLLTYYTSDEETHANSRWLSIAIRTASDAGAQDYANRLLYGPQSRAELKRVWWCCLVRDRIISLGMRRPIQMGADEVDGDAHAQYLQLEDLESEIHGSEVYSPEVKTALCHVLTSLCHFALAVSDMATIVYPPDGKRAGDTQTNRNEMKRLEEAKCRLLRWEREWTAHIDGQNAYLHSSIALFTNLVAMYYQSARIALCNHTCMLIGDLENDDENLARFESCRAELVDAISSTADTVKHFITHGVADKLPISAVAYTMLPTILLSIKTQLSTTPEDKQQHELILVLFTEVSRLYSVRYYTKRIRALIGKALALCQPSARSPSPKRRLKLRDSHSHSLSHPRSLSLFELRLPEYTRLLRYVDRSMAAPEVEVEFEGAERILIPMSSFNDLPVPDPVTFQGRGRPRPAIRPPLPLPLPAPSPASDVRREEEAAWLENLESFYFGCSMSTLLDAEMAPLSVSKGEPKGCSNSNANADANAVDEKNLQQGTDTAFEEDFFDSLPFLGE